jgi:hypothetical protein
MVLDGIDSDFIYCKPWPNNPSVIKSHVQKTKRNPCRVVSRKKAIRHPHGRPNTKETEMTWEKKGTWLKMEAVRRDAGNSQSPKAMTAQS